MNYHSSLDVSLWITDHGDVFKESSVSNAMRENPPARFLARVIYAN